MKPKILSKKGGQPSAPPHGGHQGDSAAPGLDRGHVGGASAAMPAVSARGPVRDEGKGPSPDTGTAEQTMGPRNPGAMGVQQGGPPRMGGAGPAGGQMGPGHLLRALLLKGMHG